MKNSYILLRDKTESTSLSLEELKAIGLRPTDRIWVECQSVGWRNPLEIKELKKLVSTAQPVDQPNETDASDDQTANSNQSTVAKKRMQLLEGMTVTNRLGLRKKQKTGITLTEEELKQIENDDIPENAHTEPVMEKITAPAVFTSTLADIPAAKTRKQNSITAFRLPASIKKIAMYAGLIITGALLMLLIQRVKSKPETLVQQSATENENKTASKATLPVTNSEDSIPLPTTNEAANTTLNNGTDLLVNAPIKPGSDTQKVSPASADKTTAQELSKNSREKNKNTVAEKKEPAVTAESIAARLTLKANDYKIGAFGGIRDLTMTLQNESPYLVDKVTVELSYLNPDGNAIKTQELFFQFVKPGDALSLDVYKYKRGVKVAYKIIDIESGAITRHSSGVSDGENVSKN